MNQTDSQHAVRADDARKAAAVREARKESVRANYRKQWHAAERKGK